MILNFNGVIYEVEAARISVNGVMKLITFDQLSLVPLPSLGGMRGSYVGEFCPRPCALYLWVPNPLYSPDSNEYEIKSKPSHMLFYFPKIYLDEARVSVVRGEGDYFVRIYAPTVKSFDEKLKEVKS